MRQVLSLIVLVGLAMVSHAQIKTRAYTYTTEQGLSENVVYSLLQDKQGFIWAGTHHGLNRFDGYSWKNFYHSNNDSLSLPDNVIQDMEEDHDDLWISSNRGIIKFSKKTFQSALIYPFNTKIRSGSFDLMRINDSLIAVGYYTAIGIINTNSDRIQYLKTEGDDKVSMDVRRFFRATTGKICFASQSNDSMIIFQIDEQSASVNQIQPTQIIPFKPESPIINYFVDDHNHHWLYFHEKGWKVYDQSGKPSAINLVNLPTTISTSNYISHGNKIWLSSNAGVICYDLASRQYELINNKTHSMLVNKVYCLIRDRQDNIWAGTFGGGLSKFVTADQSTNYGFQNNSDMLMGNMITGLKKMGVGNLLIHDFTNYEIRDQHFNKLESGTVNNDVSQFIRLGLNMDKAGSSRDIARIGRQMKSITNLKFLNIKTDNKGRIYQGEKIIDSTGRVILITDGHFTQVAEDKWGNSWAAASTGLYKIQPDNIVKAISFPRIQKTGSFVFTDVINGGDSVLWLATQEGMIRMDLPYLNYTRYEMSDGLPNNYIYQIQEDRLGNIWMSTNKGLSCFNIRENKFRNFGKRYGLVNSEYNSYSSSKLNDSILVFGGTAGIDFINPEKLLGVSMRIPEILITGIKINNRDTILHTGIRVPYRMNNWEISFTTNDFEFPQDIYFRYRLKGASNDWLYVKGINKAMFSILKPDKYEFQVQASFNNSEWSKVETFSFRITRPFYQAWWFYLLVLTILSLIIFLLLKYRLQQKINMLHMRNRISRDLHDEVGSSLSGIKIFSQMAEEKIDVDLEVTRNYLQKVRTYCETVLSSMNDIVWTINPDNDHFIKIYRKLHGYAISVAEPNNVTVKFSETGLTNDHSIKMDDRKNLYLIAKEAINNAIKYSACRNLEVHMQRSKDQLIMEIKDDGKGFDPEIEVNGNGLRNIRERAEDMNAELDFKTCNKGTTVKVFLRIP